MEGLRFITTRFCGAELSSPKLWIALASKGRAWERDMWRIVLIATLFLISCTSEGREADFGFKSGSGEETLADRYSINMRLPVPEAYFIKQVEGVGLQVRDYRIPDGGILPCPHFLWASKNNKPRDEIRNCLFLTNPKDPLGPEAYVAYINEKHEVFYVENQFRYSGL